MYKWSNKLSYQFFSWEIGKNRKNGEHVHQVNISKQSLCHNGPLPICHCYRLCYSGKKPIQEFHVNFHVTRSSSIQYEARYANRYSFAIKIRNTINNWWERKVSLILLIDNRHEVSENRLVWQNLDRQ